MNRQKLMAAFLAMIMVVSCAIPSYTNSENVQSASNEFNELPLSTEEKASVEEASKVAKAKKIEIGGSEVVVRQ